MCGRYSPGDQILQSASSTGKLLHLSVSAELLVSKWKEACTSGLGGIIGKTNISSSSAIQEPFGIARFVCTQLKTSMFATPGWTAS